MHVSPSRLLFPDVTLRGQLLLWTVLVCSHHGVVVNNFGVSFTDGRALCYIIHHYQPTLIPAEEICERTTLNSQQLRKPANPLPTRT